MGCGSSTDNSVVSAPVSASEPVQAHEAPAVAVSGKLCLSPDYYKNGGDFTPVKASDDIMQVAGSELVKHDALKELHRLHRESTIHHFTEENFQEHVEKWELITYAEEHVPYVTNYFFKVRIGDNHNIHIRVHRQEHEAKYNFHSLHKTIKVPIIHLGHSY
jgi:hypothetical protein